MRIYEMEEERRTEELTEVWERSVKATHSFLPDTAREELKKIVPELLAEVPHLAVIEDDRGALAGFMGLDGQELEMLFLAPEARGQGLGRQLLEFGIQTFGVSQLGMNEQNPQARGFYEQMGFAVCGRTETDGMGNPFPIRRMERRG